MYQRLGAYGVILGIQHKGNSIELEKQALCLDIHGLFTLQPQ
jgi:hypothetical protein